MGYVPLCVDLMGKTVILVGNGSRIHDKMEKRSPFGCRIRRIHSIWCVR